MAEPVKRGALLCGGIGSGKSTVGWLLTHHGAAVFDADRAGHDVLEPWGPAHDAVARRWPQVVHDGRIDRAALGRIVFAAPAELRELEALTHPHIRNRLQGLVRASTAEVIVVELPLLIDLMGEGWPRVVVDAADEVRLARLAARGMDEATARRRMAAQPSRAEWLAQADYVVANDGDLDALRAASGELWAWLRRLE